LIGESVTERLNVLKGGREIDLYNAVDLERLLKKKKEI